jgi:hypothetical protein
MSFTFEQIKELLFMIWMGIMILIGLWFFLRFVFNGEPF